jgi:hypothetical protein
MPFPKQQKHDFTPATISKVGANQAGVYGIFSHTRCIYLGRGEDIRESLLQHVNGQSGQSAYIFENDPQYWLAVVVGKQLLALWEEILLKEFQPLCKPEPVRLR